MNKTFYFETSAAAWEFFRDVEKDGTAVAGYPSLKAGPLGFTVAVHYYTGGR